MRAPARERLGCLVITGPAQARAGATEDGGQLAARLERLLEEWGRLAARYRSIRCREPGEAATLASMGAEVYSACAADLDAALAGLAPRRP